MHTDLFYGLRDSKEKQRRNPHKNKTANVQKSNVEVDFSFAFLWLSGFVFRFFFKSVIMLNTLNQSLNCSSAVYSLAKLN